MNETIAKIKEWWAQLALREKQAVAMGGSILGVILIYVAVWSPFLDRVAEMRKRIQTDDKTLAWMKAADAKIKILSASENSSERVTSPVVLLSLLQKQMDQNGLASSLTGMKQSGNDSIEMHFQQVEFDRLIRFLTEVIKQHRVTVTQMSVVSVDAPGMVNADLVMGL